MENINVKLCIDRYSQDDPDFEKWAAYVEKYVLFCLKQKEVEASLLDDAAMEMQENTCHIYVPVFSRKTLASQEYLERITKQYSRKQQKGLKLLGLIKDSVVAEKVNSLFPELTVLKMFLVDNDTGQDVSDKNLWKKENLDVFLFKIYDLCNEVERAVRSAGEAQINRSLKAVYLAEASPDVMPVRDEIRRELIKMGFEVFPSRSLVGTAKEMEKSINEYLQKSLLSIHLFGKLPQEAKVNDVAVIELENKVAAAYFSTKIETKKVKNTFSRIIWMPDNLVVMNEVQGKLLREIQRDKKLYAGADIIRSSVEELKDIILEKLHEEEKSGGGNEHKLQTQAVPSDRKIIYVINSEKNREGATAVKKILETGGWQVVEETGSGISDKERLQKCSSVLFYYIDEEPAWLRSKMSEVHEVNKWTYRSPLVKHGIISHENQELPSDDIFKEVALFKAGQVLQSEELLSFFQKAF